MMGWLRRFFSTDTRLLDEEKKHNRQLQKLLAESLKDSQAQNRSLIQTLDRVVESRFDPPLKPQPMAQPDNGFHLPVEHLSDVLSVEDDREFLERVNA